MREPFLAIEYTAFLQTLAGKAYCYHLFGSTTRTWYVRKVVAVRRAKNCNFYGTLLRFREHLSTMVCNSGTQAHRPRYRAWSAVRAWQLSLIPQISGSEPEMFDWEALEIQQLHPPTQQVAGSGRFHPCPRPFRPFPRRRNQPTRAREEGLNLQARCLREPSILYKAISPIAIWDYMVSN